MGRFRALRHCIATLSTAALACCVAILLGAGPAAAGDDGSREVSVSMQAVLRTSVAGMQIQIPVQLPAPALARLDANGTITIPKDAIAFTTGALASVPIPGSEIERMDVVATTDFIGTIDDEAGTMTLRGEVAGVLSGGGLDSCAIGPTLVSLGTANGEGLPYDPSTGNASLTTDPTFTIPAITPDTPGCNGAEFIVNSTFGLPHPPGTSSLLVTVHLEAAPTSNPPPPSAPPSSGPAGPIVVPIATPGAVAPVTDNTTTVPTTRKPGTAKPKATPSKRTNAPATGTTAAAATTTTTHVLPTDDTSALIPVPLRDGAGPPTTTDRAPIAAQFPVSDSDPDRTSFGIGVLIASLAAGIAGIALLRSEARKLFRRKRRAAF